MRSKRNIRLAVSIFIAIAMALILPGFSIAGDLEPSGPPGSTMKTLDQIPPTWSQKLPAAERFVRALSVCPPGHICVIAGAFLDKETGLVWEASPSYPPSTWTEAKYFCLGLVVDNRKGWRLPTVEELASLVDNTQYNPALPSGHPFGNVQSDFYWSATPDVIEMNTGLAYGVNMYYGAMLYADKTSNHYVWCVRGGHGYVAY